MATAARLRTAEIRRRTSDGSATCMHCGNTIGRGQTYVTHVSTDSGLTVESDYCMGCRIKAARANDLRASFWIGLFVVAFVVAAILTVEGL